VASEGRGVRGGPSGRGVLADTGPLYAIVDPDDRHHARATGETGRLTEEGIGVIVPYPIVLEAYTLVLGRLGISVAQRWLREVLDGCGTVVPQSRHYEAVADRLARFADQEISYFDALVAEIATVVDLPVWTYDSDFDVLGVEVWR